MIEELYRQFLEQQEGAILHADKDGVKIQGTKAMVCTLFTKLVEGMMKAGLDKDVIEFAFNNAFKSQKEIDKEVLESLKEYLEREQKNNE